jgi:hypothetical protein
LKGEFNIFDFYDKMERNNILLSFKGDLTVDLLNSILHVTESKLSKMEPSLKIKKKVFNVLVECLQNLYHHNEEFQQDQKDVEAAGLVLVARNENGYSVITGNFISNDSVEELKVKLERVNQLDSEELKSLYKNILDNGTYSSKGGGELGIIDIARKSGEKLDFGFVPVDKLNQFFSLNVKVNS